MLQEAAPPSPTAREFDLSAARRWVLAECRRDGADALRLGDAMVDTLAQIGVDSQCLLGALLQPLWPLTEEERAQLQKQFGEVTVTLLMHGARLRQLSELAQTRGAQRAQVNEENLRKMLISMVDDVRVVLIELARHLVELRAALVDAGDAAVGEQPIERESKLESKFETKLAPKIETKLEHLHRLGRVTLEVYAPLANRLGVGALKWRLEDGAFRCLHPRDYRLLAAQLDEKRALRESYIGALCDELRALLAAQKIRAEVHGRPKHLYGIWKKMRRKGLAFDDLQDLRAVRVIVDDADDCYAALAAVHTRWRHFAAQFSDYIATPKANGYQSIHSVVTGPHDKVVEIQIRTRAMHQQSELGGAAHWRYKESLRDDDDLTQKVLRLRQLLQWQDDLHSAQADDESNDALSDESNNASNNATSDAPSARRIYVFTPKGMVIDLPNDATPLDFAYAVHTQVGHATRGAHVDGKMRALNRALVSGEQVHIHTVKNGAPSRDWLRAELGYVRTRRARARIAAWFKRADFAQHAVEGRALLERELSRLGLDELSYDKIARAAHFQKTDDLLAAIGAGDFKVSRALAPHQRRIDASRDSYGAKVALKKPPPRAPGAGVRIGGVDNLVTRMAHCCSPLPGDAIVGFVTGGRGVSIHRRDCNNVRNVPSAKRARLIEVQWNEAQADAYPVDIRLIGFNRGDLLHDVTRFLNERDVAVLRLTLDTDADDNATIRLRVAIGGVDTLKKIMRDLGGIAGIVRVQRMG